MLKKVLQEMSAGQARSYAELARRLDIDEALLSQMLADLARKGYLAPLAASGSACGGCSGSGAICAACSGCSPGGNQMVKGWTLTEKGRQTLETTRRAPHSL